MARKRSWKQLLDSVTVEGRIHPVSAKAIDRFEHAVEVGLPRSYCDFLGVFGPGKLNGRISIDITAPSQSTPSSSSSARSATSSIETLNEDVWSTRFIDLDEYCADPALIRNGLFFGKDIYTHHYFWNRTEITDKARHEMAIYVIYREWTSYRLADSFESFIYDICFDKGIPDHGKLNHRAGFSCKGIEER
jgi:hypothetical protein